ncbi:MAG: glycosyltransferase family 2 protein [Chloroflexi bacterium]|nr:glycosyltransferase family 2 protein [Chloroflexota bacterium]
MNSMNMATISVVIPSHNRRERLARALSHLYKQTYPTDLLELVVVLDGCTDGSAHMLEELQATIPVKLKVINQAQGGPAAARNAGVRAASNEYILFIDDDVMATPQLIMEHWLLHENDPKAVVIGPMSTPKDHQRPIWVRWEEYILEGQYQDLLNGKYEFTPRQFYTGNCSFKRSWMIEAGMFDENFKRYEDVELAYRMSNLGVNFYFNPKAIGYHYAHRSYSSWKTSHYLYGHYDVKMEREKGLEEWIDLCETEFRGRHWITRFLATRTLNHKTTQQLLSFILLQVAQIASFFGQERRGYQALSSIANMLYWQGFNEELNKPTSANLKASL